MSIRKVLLPTIAAAAIVASGAGVAAATGVTGNLTNGSSKATGTHTHTGAVPVNGAELPVDSLAEASNSDITYLAASLQGRNEVPSNDGKAVGDRDGSATALIRIQGDKLWYALRWNDIAAPTAGHVHLGVKGSNGAVKVPFFAGTLPDTARGVAGVVRVTDKATLDELKNNPTGFYANIHTGEFPGGAVRGQFHKLSKPADLNGVLIGSSPARLQAAIDGAQEIPNPEGKKTGDPDGRGTAFARSHDGMISWGFTWASIGQPTVGHIHQGAKGMNGPVAADLFEAPSGLPAGVTGLAGMTPVRGDIARKVMRSPDGFYANLHTAEFPGGAVRGQFAPFSGTQSRTFTKPVIQGEQIYRCTKQADGSFAFTQEGVKATLVDGIKHSFVNPGPQGPPQWVARDGSAVTGKAVTKTPNGDGNIPELVLDATQVGAKSGLLAGATQVLRLNTIGGVAPTGACDPNTKPIAKVPYQADYVFLG
ncbi:CHRD domain-containing protein [Actinomadura barringtoniae]|uniref:CHRD domain-containing protein n=1 Tax=Actinomadura barringtoniae TaxID=1427535 RepID=A0A939T630_9ACTN|nr:CHRD domain-containing protein [Actinomadura barringtoniae]MBO2450294.1 CHRD domain-containing protein [Actinomadura barringtoniae]